MRTNEMIWIETLIDEYSQFDNTLKNEIVGATEKDLSLLKERVGRDIPDYYLEYMKYSGGSDTGLLSGLSAHTDIKNLLLTYEEIDEFPDDFPTGDWILIGAGHAGVDIILNSVTGAVHECYGGEVGKFLVPSFQIMVKQQAFLKLKVLGNKENVSYSASVNDIKETLGAIDKSSLYSFILKQFSGVSSPLKDLCDPKRVLCAGKGLYCYSEITNQLGLMFSIGGQGSEKIAKNIAEKIGATI